MQPKSQAQRHAMFGFEKGSIADQMTDERRRQWRRWLTQTNADAKVKEAQLSHGVVARPRSIQET